ncbi:unnamed protein product [Linum trigynum]|uniref:Uncharacterized protein n=1 Tax=Linum trigynum TaxID=586398 RepID=A0AAV2EAT3_9ROSI
MEVKYQKLPMFCYSYGRIGHLKLKIKLEPKPEVDPYGYELRVAAPGPKNWLSYTAKKEESEVWTALRQKFEMKSIRSNSNHDMALEQKETRLNEEQTMPQQRVEGKKQIQQIPLAEKPQQPPEIQQPPIQTVKHHEKKGE